MHRGVEVADVVLRHLVGQGVARNAFYRRRVGRRNAHQWFVAIGGVTGGVGAVVVFIFDRTGRTWRAHRRIGRCADAQGQVFADFVDAVLFWCDRDARCRGAARWDFHIKAGAEQGRNCRRIGHRHQIAVDIGVADAVHVRWAHGAAQADMYGYIKATCCCLSDVIHQVIS